MGLDMYLYHNNVKNGEQVGCWRKANAIHAWIESNVARGSLDNCETVDLTADDLFDLRADCLAVLAHRTSVPHYREGYRVIVAQGGGRVRVCNLRREGLPHIGREYSRVLTPEGVEVAKELLPTEEGFFFGSTDYNWYYVEYLQQTVEMISTVLAEDVAAPDDHYTYYAWW